MARAPKRPQGEHGGQPDAAFFTSAIIPRKGPGVKGSWRKCLCGVGNRLWKGRKGKGRKGGNRCVRGHRKSNRAQNFDIISCAFSNLENNILRCFSVQKDFFGDFEASCRLTVPLSSVKFYPALLRRWSIKRYAFGISIAIRTDRVIYFPTFPIVKNSS